MATKVIPFGAVKGKQKGVDDGEGREQPGGAYDPADAEPLEPMEKGEVQTYFQAVVRDAIQYNDDEIAPLRATATKYYHGEPFGNEEPGRSQVVLTEVRDGISGVMPDMLRLFFGPERTVEFVPKRATTAEQARQATDYVRYVFLEDNNGVMQMYAALKDALIRKMGIVKWTWDDTSASETHKLYGITQDELTQLMVDPSIEVTSFKEEEGGQTLTVELIWTRRDGRPRVYVLPPEEFIFSREARSIDEALFVGHRTEKTRGELIAMGIDAEVIDGHSGTEGVPLRLGFDETARRQIISSAASQDPPSGDANRKISYVEGYWNVDENGDGVAELRRVCGIGPTFFITSDEPVAERPFAVFCPDPEPHTMVGSSWADRLMPMQKTKSAVLRATLDSAASAIFPRTWVVEGQVTIADVLNTRIGSPIRMHAPGMAGEFSHSFIGKEMFQILGYLDQVIERSTGRNNGTIGLDADALQSTSQQGVNAAITSNQAQSELLCRLFAEQMLKPMFRGLLRLLVEHQPRAKMVRLRDKWVEVDPKSWDADMDVIVNVGLGDSYTQGKIQALLATLGAQKEALQILGAQNNPLVGLGQYRYTLGRLLELNNIPDTDNYFKPMAVTWEPPPTPPAPPQPTPEQVIAQAQLETEKMKATKELAIKEAELRLKEQELQMKREDADRRYELEKANIAMNATLKRYQIDAQFHADYTEQQADLDASKTQSMLDALLEAEKQHHQQEMDAHAAATAAAAASAQPTATPAGESAAAAPAPAPPPQVIHVAPVIHTHHHAAPPAKRKTKVTRDEQGNVTGMESVDEGPPSLPNLPDLGGGSGE
jgi:hypothetical protein